MNLMRHLLDGKTGIPDSGRNSVTSIFLFWPQTGITISTCLKKPQSIHKFGLKPLLPFVNVIRLDFAFGESGEGIFSHFGVIPEVEKQCQRIG